MTADNALRLEQWLGVEAAFWMNLQNWYDLDLATEKYGEKISSIRSGGGTSVRLL
jgi:plasmid maintenance system antidote protein VapI